jgi:phosphoribosyl 1,2-cyclic phosphodiesterase
MPLTVRAIASGSSGNAFLVETEDGCLLLDAGLSAARLHEVLQALTPRLDSFHGIILTHEHTDHACGALRLARKLDAPIYATRGTLDALRADEDDRPVEQVVIVPGRTTTIDGLRVTAFSVSHDAVEPVGLLLERDGFAVALATDLGTIDARTIEWTGLADLLILEANHDLHKLWNGPYPRMLKRRIASPTGHLSNDQAAAGLAGIVERGRVKWAWLAHLSEVNNSQRAALAAVQARLGGGDVVVEIARRHRPSLVWRSDQLYRQGRLF